MPAVAASSSGRITGTNTLTFSHTVSSGTNRYLILFCNVSSGITSLVATYGGVSLTKTNDIDNASGAPGPGRLVIFELINPTVGTANIVLSGSAGGFSLCGCAVTLTDCLSVSTLSTTEGNSTAPSVTISSQVGGLVLDVLGYPLNNVALTVGAGQTSIVEQESIADASRKLAVSSEPGATSVTMSWTMASSGIWISGALTALSTSTAIARLSQLPVEVATLSSTPIQLRLSQLPIEVLINTSIVPSTSAETTQFLIIM